MRTTNDGVPVINAADEIDRLIAFHASVPDLHHRLPFLRAIRSRRLSMCEVNRGGMPNQRELVRLGANPVLLLIGDDDYQSSGPSGWPALRFRQWKPVKVVVHATGGSEALSQDIVDAAQLLRRVLLIETDAAHAAAWRDWAETLKASHGVMTLLPLNQHPAPETAH